MSTSEQKPEPGADGDNLLHEADIGSGERTPGQQETDELIKSIPPLTDDARPGEPAKG